MVALVKEGDFPGFILPKGRLEPGEACEEAARREIAEESGLEDLRLLGYLGTRERLSFDRRWWIITRYYLYLTSQTGGEPSDASHDYVLRWFPLDDLPDFTWPEQHQLLQTSHETIRRLAEKGRL
ncbi:MAG: NUDIX domain-containing protein [Anaerolineae bacterium]|nr:NUDIX domain-containing protein [Anaerolineae bacterium]